MPTSLVAADSLLAVEVGAVSTRAALFDVVEGRYRFLASSAVPTTAGAPFLNVSEGVHTALDRLQRITGRVLLGPDEDPIMPSGVDGSGIDTFAAMVSAGPPLKVVAIGLLEDVSLESARRLATTSYCQVLETIGLNDRRKPDVRIDSILRLRPDLIVVAGGTQDGASQSVLRLLEPVGLACYLMPESQRPHLLFAGNQALKDEIQENLGGFTHLHFAPNIRPLLDYEELDAAQAEVARIYSRIRSQRMLGVSALNTWAKGGLVPTATALGRIVRFWSKARAAKKGIMGVDVGASATTIATADNGDLALGVYPQFGLGRCLSDLLQHVPLQDITRWLTLEIPDQQVHAYLLNKAIYPASLPATPEELEIEQAIARQVMQSAAKVAAGGFPEKMQGPGEGLLPYVDRIVATGSVLTRAPSLAHSVLTLLDGLQPTGITELYLDQNHMAAALGAAAAVNPVLAVQSLSSNAILHLGTVITPVADVRPGTLVLRLKVTYDNNQQTNLEVKQGSLEVIPVSFGQSVRIQLHPLHHADVGWGVPGRGGELKNLTGSALGIIVDARGRPYAPPPNLARRNELYRKWLWTFGGQSGGN
ncbi:MAG: glutamate mutase L [Chloroflexota bacterium]